MSRNFPKFVPADLRSGVRVAIVAARFNDHLVEPMLAGCEKRLETLGFDADHIEVHRVPGAFELPVVAKVLADTRRVAAVICLGAVVRGETPHFDFVAGQCAAGIARVALDTGVPIIFGVLTVNTEQQALDRIGGIHGHAGDRAAEAAAEMILVLRHARDGQ